MKETCYGSRNSMPRPSFTGLQDAKSENRAGIARSADRCALPAAYNMLFLFTKLCCFQEIVLGRWAQT